MEIEVKQIITASMDDWLSSSSYDKRDDVIFSQDAERYPVIMYALMRVIDGEDTFDDIMPLCENNLMFDDSIANQAESWFSDRGAHSISRGKPDLGMPVLVPCPAGSCEHGDEGEDYIYLRHSEECREAQRAKRTAKRPAANGRARPAARRNVK